jgi:predicted PurR-regulated permease PerM
VPDELPESDRRVDRGLLARDRRRKKEPAERDAAGSATAHASTAEADDGTPDDGAETGGATPKGPRRRRWWRRRDRSADDRREPEEAHEGSAGAQGGVADAGEAETADHPLAGAGGLAAVGGGVIAAPTVTTAGDTAEVAAPSAADGAEVADEDAQGGIPRPRGRADADPVTDVKAREREAGVDERFPFGRPGRPLTRNHPFVFGFYGALGVLAAYMLVQALTNARQVIILIVVALFLAVGLNPGVEALERLGISRRWSVLLVFLALVGFFVGFGFAIVPPLSEQTTAIIHNLTSGHGYLEQLQNNPRLQDLDKRYHLLQKARTALQSKDLGTRAANGVVGVGQVVLSGVFSTLTVLILTLYFLSSLPSITGFMYRLAPRSRRARVALLGDEILTRIGGYVAGNLLISLIAGVTAYIFLLIVGVPYALALALLVAITDLIPLVGATIGAVFVTALSFFSGPWVGIATGIYFLIYQQVENYIIQPRVMKRSVDVQPAVTIIAALIGGALLGVIGALLAIPAAAAVALIVREVVMPRQEES